ncbi:hypothetical protein [Mycobacterium sp. AZCC_0083]|uniref:hypothetical protein n=1 Tax=Mycobacterium sp. AZCC_0083 TaxID=2735882 RepID=UPI0016190B98|nr:hypothetical protein [Mycobacterium sp. AZCC_0083]MBB5166710.1 hypothetical protein [Mycobacterium sp. AZCC_0083]
MADQNNYDETVHQPDAARDILFHFCLDAFHLRDWIQNASTLTQAVRDDVRHLFRSSTQPQQVSSALAACADIANGTKHLVLTHPPYTPGGPAEVTGQTQGARFPMTLPFHFAANHWTINVGGAEHDALDLANRAVADWDAWLTARGIALPT